MASIRKRDGKWQVQIRRQGHHPLTRTFFHRTDAITWARNTEARLDRNDLPPNIRQLRSCTVADLLMRYGEEVTPRKRGADIERIRLNCMMRYPLAKLTLDCLKPIEIARYRDERLTKVTGETVRRELGVFHHMLKTAQRDWGIPLSSNPADLIEKPKPSLPRTRRLKAGEFERLLAAANSCRNKILGPLISCAVASGMRRGEMLAARWEHLDVERRLLYLPMTKNGHPRHVPLSDQALAAIEACRDLDPIRIFPTSATAVRLAWDRLTKRAGIDDLHFHDLRHEAISRFFELGLTVPEVASISGHRDPRMLFRYAHADPARLAQKLT